MTASKAARTTAFVAAWDGARPRQSDRALCLADFVLQWRRLAGERSTVALIPAAPTLTARRHADLILALGPALKAARTSGASFNILQMAGFDRKELPNARALAELLKPRGRHSLGTLA